MTTASIDPVSDDTTSQAPTVSSPTGRARTIALICLLAASFMELMDATVVNVALRTLQEDLGASTAGLQWVVAGYPLAYAVGLVLGARLGDNLGRRKVFVAGLAAFGLASLACGLAGGPGELVAFRLVQGAAAALMVPQVLSNIQVLYPPAERGRAMGMFTSVIGLAAVVGPVLGAVITSGDWFGLGWRPIFLINVPLAAIAIVAALVFIPETRAERPSPITAGSAALLAGALAAVLVPITLGPENDWPLWGFGVMVLGVVGLAAFARRQSALARAGVEAMVPPALFASPSFARGIGAFALLTVPVGGYFLVQSLHVQAALGWSVLHTGLMWIPFSVAVPVSAGLAATVLADRIGKHVLQVGAAVMVLGMALMVMAEGSAHPGLWFAVSLVVAGLGFGAIVGSSGLLVLHDVPVRLAGAASGVFTTAQALSVALGAAVVGTVYSSVSDGHGLEVGYRAAFVVMMGLILAGGVAAQAMPQRTVPVEA